MPQGAKTILLTLPVYNEEALVDQSVRQVVSFCRERFAGRVRVLIVDNQSTDRTGEIGRTLAESEPDVRYLYLDRKGKGAAIRAGWLAETADVYVFMDIDLSTDLEALLPAVGAIEGGAALALGSRYAPGARVERSWARKRLSGLYRLLIRVLLRSRILDAPCGFKAVDRSVRNEVLPRVEDESWFFDSELVLLAERLGYRWVEIPVHWQERRRGVSRSRVNVWRVGSDYVKKVIALRRRFRHL